MSVYIKGVEMPTRCYACPCADLEYYDCNLIPGTRIEQHKRLDDCPLVPVPPHGRLIDADALMAVAEPIKDHRGNVKCVVWDAHINRQPTIIPADPAEEGE